MINSAMPMLKLHNPLAAKLIIAVLILLAGEMLSRAYDAYESWKKYQAWSVQTVTYRDQTYTQAKPKGVRRVLLLGGSAVYDTVKDYRESWPFRLEQLLRDKLKSPVEVINMAYFSEFSIDELFKLHDVGVGLQPDLVIVFNGENDVYNLWDQYDYWKKLYELKTKNLLKEKKHDPFTRFFGNLRKNCSLYQRLKRFKTYVRTQASVSALDAQRTAAAPAAGTPAAVNPQNGAPQQEVLHPDVDRLFEPRARWDEIYAGYLEIYGSNLDKMGKLITRAGAKGLFIFQPDLSYKALLAGQVSSAERGEYLKVIRDQEETWKDIQKRAFPAGLKIMQETAARYGFPFEDFNAKLLLKGDVSPLFEGNVHFTPQGREVIARAVTDLILENKLLKN